MRDLFSSSVYLIPNASAISDDIVSVSLLMLFALLSVLLSELTETVPDTVASYLTPVSPYASIVVGATKLTAAHKLTILIALLFLMIITPPQLLIIHNFSF